MSSIVTIGELSNNASYLSHIKRKFKLLTGIHGRRGRKRECIIYVLFQYEIKIQIYKFMTGNEKINLNNKFQKCFGK